MVHIGTNSKWDVDSHLKHVFFSFFVCFHNTYYYVYVWFLCMDGLYIYNRKQAFMDDARERARRTGFLSSATFSWDMARLSYMITKSSLQDGFHIILLLCITFHVNDQKKFFLNKNKWISTGMYCNILNVLLNKNSLCFQTFLQFFFVKDFEKEQRWI